MLLYVSFRTLFLLGRWARGIVLLYTSMIACTRLYHQWPFAPVCGWFISGVVLHSPLQMASLPSSPSSIVESHIGQRQRVVFHQLHALTGVSPPVFTEI
jgi:hypothetical protein